MWGGKFCDRYGTQICPGWPKINYPNLILVSQTSFLVKQLVFCKVVETDLIQLDSERVAVAEGAVVVVGALAGPAAVVTLGAEARRLAVEALRTVDHAASLLQGQSVRTFYTTHT